MANQHAGRGVHQHTPVIDDRTIAQLTEQLKRMVPNYTPEWRFRPEDPDPGTALALMFLHLLEGNLQRLNRVPYKSFLAFLNRFHVELAQARPAIAQVAFQLIEGAPEPVYVEQGTQLSANVPGEPDPVLFETARPVLVTTSHITDLIKVSPLRDSIIRLAGEDAPFTTDDRGTALFGLEGDNLQEHTMYIRHDFLFLLNHPAYIELTVYNTENEHAVAESVELLTNTELVTWEYSHNGEWLPFDRVYGRASVIRLVKLSMNAIDPVDCQGHTGYWIRCRAATLDDQAGGAALGKVQLDRISMLSTFAAANDEDGILPERLYFNDIQIDAEEGCRPFGDYFAQYGLFYMANREAFSKRGAQVTIRFQAGIDPLRLIPDKPPQINWKMIMKRHEVDKTEVPDPVTIARVQWEYWNGFAWVRLPVPEEQERMFSVPWQGTEERELSFVCPEDIEEILVNAEENFWIRGRIIQVNNAYSPDAMYYSPRLQHMKIRFSYEQPAYPPQQLLTMNNLDVHERTNEVQTGGITFRPYIPLDGRHPVFMIGFDTPPERGPISIYTMLNERRVTEADVPLMEWEYLKRTGAGYAWSPLPVSDETNAFTRSGDIQFVGPRDFAQASFFGVSRYWIRAVNRDVRYDRELEAANVPRLLHLSLNTTMVYQQETIRGELPQFVEEYDPVEEDIRESFVLAQTPVLQAEVWVDETGDISNEEMAQLARENDRIELIHDSSGEVIRAWVKYDRVKQFLKSGPHDRHYVIDLINGQLSFGNGKAGRKLPNPGNDAVRVHYTSGGGKRGNVPAGAINSLQGSIAFIDSVVNPFPAAGGCEPGTVEEAIVRGPKLFTHRNRGVTAQDYEWLAREAHPNVAKVKCLPNVNVKLEPQPGALSVVVVPRSGIGEGDHFQELKQEVEARLMSQAAANVAFQGNLQVMAPAMLEIGVYAKVSIRDMEDAVPVERACLAKLDRYLNPLTGGSDGNGWDIGQHVHPSMFYALLKSAGPVVHVSQLAIQVYKVENGERIEWHPDRLEQVPHGIVTPGEHRIVIEMKKE